MTCDIFAFEICYKKFDNGHAWCTVANFYLSQTINKKFSGQIQSSEPAFPDEYFTCTSVCEACQARCCLFMNHSQHDNGSKHHQAERQCKYHHQFDNKVSLIFVFVDYYYFLIIIFSRLKPSWKTVVLWCKSFSSLMSHLLKVFLCRKCDYNGERSLVVPKTSSAKDSTWLGLAKFAWSGWVKRNQHILRMFSLIFDHLYPWSLVPWKGWP